MIFIIAFCLSFVSIFLKGFSQQNVQYRRKALMIPTSICLATAEMLTAGVFVSTFLSESLTHSIALAMVIGVGGGIGCMLSLDFHRWLSNKIYKWGEKVDKVNTN